MGNVMGFVGKGVPGLLSFPRDRIFDNCFKDVDSFEKFHLAFLKVCSEFNSIMPGNHFQAPSLEQIEKYYEEWKNKNDGTARKQYMVDLLTEHMKRSKTGKAMVMTGLVAPSAAMALKRVAEGTPPIKKFKVDMVPDVVFVPSVTLLALLGVKWYNLGTINKNQNSGGGQGAEQSRSPQPAVTSWTVPT
ncbi:hypothetical protein QJS10_CPA01g02787 [Acorus calamus]|uniref:Uncharacterized protein n=1 Tax=Acorus calamus TaxID=4465 RepID=A0AAV9FKI2_ACOCL|nr:hypothetical protein QJS10_CPA01g02787 [Acorus calamus]